MRGRTTVLRRLTQDLTRRAALSVPTAIHPHLRELAISRSRFGRPTGHAMAGLMRHGGVPRGVTTFGLADRPELQFAASDSLIASRLYWAGESGWEPELVPWWRFACLQANRIAEIGANIGYFTVQGASAAPGTPYRSVEPHPISANALRENVSLNGLANVEIIESAAVRDSTVTSVALCVPELDHYGTPAGAFVAGDVRSHLTVGSEIEVPGAPVTDLIAGCDLLKLDVEGQEAALLGAVLEELVEVRPTIFVEVLDEAKELRTVLEALATRVPYSLYLPLSNGLVAIPPDALRSLRLQRDGQGQDLILTTNPSFQALSCRYR